RPSPAADRLAIRFSCLLVSGASVAMIIIIDPSGVSLSSSLLLQSANKASVRFPKLLSTSVPTVYDEQSCSIVRDAVPIPPLYPKQTIPFPAPIAPSSTGALDDAWMA